MYIEVVLGELTLLVNRIRTSEAGSCNCPASFMLCSGYFFAGAKSG